MQPKRSSKNVLIDTNVWISSFINPRGYPAKIIDLWLNKKIEVVISFPLLREIAEVLRRSRLQGKYGYKNSEIEKYLTLIVTGAKLISISSPADLCRDPKDNHILEAAIKGKCKYLITRDDDIKGDSDIVRHLSKYKVEVITVSNFLKLFTFNE